MVLLLKSTMIKIKKSMGRFISILLIVALGMGFFAGIRSSSPSMFTTINEYFNKNNLMDVKILSTMGLTNDDASALKEIDSTIKVIPSHSIDVLENGSAIRIHALSDVVNKVTLTNGRMPKNINECLGDKDKYKIGDKLTFTGNTEYLKSKTCTITGTIDSVLYIAKDKGIASTGNGKLESYIFMLDDVFNMDYYTEIYLLMDKGNISAYSDEYQKMYDELYAKLLEIKPIREAIRYEEILKEATDKINKIEKEAKSKINDAKKELTKALNNLNNNKNKLEQEQEKINKTINELDNKLKEQSLNKYTIDTAINSISITIDNLTSELNTLDKDSAEYQAKYEYLNTVKKEKNNLETIKSTYNKLDAAQEKIDKSMSELNTGYDKYNENKEKLAKEEETLQNKINDAKKELNTIEQPIWYIQNRSDNNGFTNFYDDASVVEKIANIFPLFFIIIVALIILNTITRMIEEERTEIGTLKSLGYSNFNIIIMYILYSFIASLIGTFFGLLGGYLIIPNVIYNIYDVTYILPKLIITISPLSFIIMILTGVILIVSVTIFACLKELKDVPATLLRPKAPKKGKKVLLENIKVIWSKLSFIWKITIRNLFRYKKRIIMTIVGVSGSTALLIAGFGLKDSISNIANIQYNKIIKYDALVVFDKSYNDIENNIKEALKNNNINDYLKIHEDSYTFMSKDNKINNAYLMATDSDINKYISLKDINTNKEIKIPDYGVIITRKMADILNVKENDNIEIRNSSNKLFILNVKGIVENYTLNYIYMNDYYYKIIFDEELKYNSLLINSDNFNKEKLSKELIALDSVNMINYTSDNITTFDNMINGINNIVYLIIVCACLLSVIILYNLTIININERKREIATLKVLGFNDKEISSYVYREILILTIMGIILGIFLGKQLHMFIINSSEPDNMVFIKEIKTLSYIFSALFVFIFMFIVRILTYFRLIKIDMIESLKSVE